MNGSSNRFISIRIKITLMAILITVVTMGVVSLFFSIFLDDIFLEYTKRNLITTFNSCSSIFSERDLYDTEGSGSNQRIGEYFEAIDNPAGATVYIIDYDSFYVYSSVVLTDDIKAGIKNLLLTFDFSQLDGPERYQIRESHDYSSNEDYYELIGKLVNGNYAIIRCPIKRIDNTVQFVFQLFISVTFILVALEMIAMLIFSNRIVKPIRNMSDVSKRMSELDFDAKIEPGSNDEIGELGESMNQMSEKLERAISELKRTNLELSSDIEQRLQIDEMRKEFLSHVSHELKTPIALVQGYAEGLKDSVSDDPESIDFYCDVIIDESNKMNNLVMRLLDLNELESGGNSLDIERFNITDLINDIIKASQILINSSGAKVVFEERSQYVWADEFMTEEVFTNYLTNAIHYVKKGGLIKIWYEQRQESLRICVYDEGSSIKDEDLDKVFVKFYKADAARTREYGGSGIGLSIVEAIMKAHNKDYGVYNADGGVVFYFELDNTDTYRI